VVSNGVFTTAASNLKVNGVELIGIIHCVPLEMRFGINRCGYNGVRLHVYCNVLSKGFYALRKKKVQNSEGNRY
jgi:hypothetical protein